MQKITSMYQSPIYTKSYQSNYTPTFRQNAKMAKKVVDNTIKKQDAVLKGTMAVAGSLGILHGLNSISEGMKKGIGHVHSYFKKTPVDIKLADGTIQSKYAGKLVKEISPEGNVKTYYENGDLQYETFANGGYKKYGINDHIVEEELKVDDKGNKVLYKNGKKMAEIFNNGVCRKYEAYSGHTYLLEEFLPDGTHTYSDGFGNIITAYPNGANEIRTYGGKLLKTEGNFGDLGNMSEKKLADGTIVCRFDGPYYGVKGGSFTITKSKNGAYKVVNQDGELVSCGKDFPIEKELGINPPNTDKGWWSFPKHKGGPNDYYNYDHDKFMDTVTFLLLTR